MTLETVCKACPYNAYRQAGDRSGHICLRPEHIVELQQAQKEEREARTKAALDAMDRKKREMAEATRRQQEAVRNKAGQEVVGVAAGRGRAAWSGGTRACHGGAKKHSRES